MSRVITTSTIKSTFGNCQGRGVVAQRDERVDHVLPRHANLAAPAAARAAYSASSSAAAGTAKRGYIEEKSSMLSGLMQGWHLLRPAPRRSDASA